MQIPLHYIVLYLFILVYAYLKVYITNCECYTLSNKRFFSIICNPVGHHIIYKLLILITSVSTSNKWKILNNCIGTEKMSFSYYLFATWL